MSEKIPTHKTFPDSREIKKKRKEMGLTQKEAAALVCSTSWRWIDWESGNHRMHPGLWKLFLIRTRDLEMRAVEIEAGGSS